MCVKDSDEKKENPVNVTVPQYA